MIGKAGKKIQEKVGLDTLGNKMQRTQRVCKMFWLMNSRLEALVPWFPEILNNQIEPAVVPRAPHLRAAAMSDLKAQPQPPPQWSSLGSGRVEVLGFAITLVVDPHRL